MNSRPQDESQQHATRVWHDLETLVQRFDWITLERIQSTVDRPLDLPLRVSLQFQAQSIGDPPYGSLNSASSTSTSDSEEKVTWIDTPVIELEFPVSFPDSAPRLKWDRRLFHPNVSSSGRGELRDIGINWQPEMTLDVLVERLWDVCRGAFYQAEPCENSQALEWYQQRPIPFPWDQRTFASPRELPNIVRYQRKDSPEPSTAKPSNAETSTAEPTIVEATVVPTSGSQQEPETPTKPAPPVFFIDDAPPPRRPSSPPASSPPGSDDDIHFID